ncbi:aminoglycoside phosphotransferase family protein [Nocardia spumae]|uniref:aminoglycoside phosphotransferase family protein n=1 Tax=Nocardia spumae TaxID=2887190 RepID=UPI001D15193F|nr:aminoglycoside phosphotransferase family protein [Nocardia spumae]
MNEVNQRILEGCGVEVTVAARFGEVLYDDGPTYVFLHHNNGSRDTLPSGVGWVSRTMTNSLTFADARHETIVGEWFRCAGDGLGTVSTCDWVRPDWFGEVSEWITAAAGRHGYQPSGPIEQIVSSPHSTVLRTPTSGGDLYFKATPAVFAHEPRLLESLARLFPERLPDVVAIDSERGWSLTKDVGSFVHLEPTLADVPRYEEVVRGYAAMQKELAGDVNALLALGVPDRRPAALLALLDEILEDVDSLVFDGEESLTREEYDRIVSFRPRFAELCERMAEFGTPNTLVDMDFWRGNIALTPGRWVLLDWAEAVVGSPMQSMVTVLNEFRVTQVANRDELHRRLLGAYLAEWADYESPERIREAYEIARPAAVLCRTQSWRAGIASLATPYRHQYLRRAVAVNLRKLIEFTSTTP